MRCRVCGGSQRQRVTDLPFKVGDTRIVIVRALPVLQCSQCGDTELDNDTMRRVDEVLTRLDASSELAVVRFAA